MAKYDDFDLDMRNDEPNGALVYPSTNDLICLYTLSICVDTIVSVVASECCTNGCTSACGTPSQGCTTACDQTYSACHSYCGSACRR